MPANTNKFYVYVIELDPAVRATISWKNVNPDQTTSECYYVGQTAHSPECRFEQHMAPRRSVFKCICHKRPGKIVNEYQIGGATFVAVHGKDLETELTETLHNTEAAKTREKELTEELRNLGHGAYSR